MPEDDDARLREAPSLRFQRPLPGPERDPLSGRGDVLGRILEEESAPWWASFGWVMQLDLDTALEQQEGLTEFVDNRRLMVKTAALEAAIDPWYSGTTLACESGCP